MAALSGVEVLVVGAGPGGLAAANLLAALGREVLVLERRRRPLARPGETLRADARVELIRLGVWERFCAQGHLPCHGVASAWGAAELARRDSLFNPFGVGWHLDRAQFDRMLAEAAEDAGATLLRGARPVETTRESASWRVSVEHDHGEQLTARPRFLIDASGQGRWLASEGLAAWRGSDPLIALVGVVEGVEQPQSSELLLEACATGWWYSIPQPGGTLAAVYVTDRQRLDGDPLSAESVWTADLAHSQHTALRLRGGKRTHSVRGRDVPSGLLEPVSGPGWVAVGDAASCWDPLAGAGVTRALEGGVRVGQAVAAALDGDGAQLAAYAEDMRAAQARYTNGRAQLYADERRFTQEPFWRRRSRGAA